MDSGAQGITDQTELAAVRKQALGVHLRSLAAGVVLTGAALALPALG